jgi:polyisoprenoid-binding protein YceI
MTNVEAEVVHYRLNADKSRLIVQAFAEGLFSSFGHNPTIAARDFTGEASFVPGTLHAAQVRVTVRADSLTTVDDIKDSDRQEIERLMHEVVLETAKYPEIVFQSTSARPSRSGEGRYRVMIVGDLTLHGVTQRNLWISAQLNISDDTLRTQGDFSLRQSDYGIKLVSVAGGTLKVKNEVKVSFDIHADKV